MWFVLAILIGFGMPQASLDSEGLFLQVTVPGRTRPNEREALEKKVAYIITIDGKSYTLLLRKHSFLSQNFLVYTYNETGPLHSESSSFMIHCYYQGYVAQLPYSAVTLNICSGLRGFLQFENITYGIEPLESSAKFEHIIYHVKTGDPDVSMLSENFRNIWHKDQLYKVHLSSQDKPFSELLPRYLEMHIIVDKDLYDYMGSEMMAVTQKIVQIIGLVNTMFSQFKLTVMLSSLELWSDENQISTSGDADNILQRFLAWKQEYLVLQPHDIAHLLMLKALFFLTFSDHNNECTISYRKHPKYVGATFPGTICNKNYDAGIALYSDVLSLEGFSVVIAQLLGLHMGLTYDDISNCSCPRAACIMNHKALSSSGTKIFSNCSMNEYRHFTSKFEAKCLQKLSDLKPLYQNAPVCGNGILEPTEECDCGNEKECQFKKCCDYNTCKLRGSALCGSGSCCTSKCELAVAGTPCRKRIDQECDFTEYCNGTSHHCVPDTYAINGHLCRFGTAYCYNGQCQTTDQQCAKIFGKDAQGAPYACFQKVNSPLEKSGNCGFKNERSCEKMDVLCGKLACVWSQKNTNKSAVQSAVYSYIHDNVCVSLSPGSSVSSDGRDNSYVADGTVCGPQMYCINKTCRQIHLLRYNCNAAKNCNGNGICNNLGHCQCFPGHIPPDCKFQIGSPGGSIDDGNVRKSNIYFNKKDYSAHRDNWLILSFYIFLPFFIIFIIVIIKRNEMRKSCNRENTEYEGNSTIVPGNYHMDY